MSAFRVVEHVIGPLEDGLQECSRCGEVLTDYRNVSYPVEQGPPGGLTPGERFVVHKTLNGARMSISRGLGELMPGLASYANAIAVSCEPVLEHVTGKPEGKKQLCSRCGEVLLDFSERPEDFAPEGVAVVATQTLDACAERWTVLPHGGWRGPTRLCSSASCGVAGDGAP